MTTTFEGSQTFAFRRSSIGLRRRGPLESCTMARSTLQVTISPGVTDFLPAARATSFCASVSSGLKKLLEGLLGRLGEVGAPADGIAAGAAQLDDHLRGLGDHGHAVDDRRAADARARQAAEQHHRDAARGNDDVGAAIEEFHALPL